LVALLTDGNNNVRGAGAHTLAKLSEKGKRNYDCSGIPPLIDIPDEFQPVILDSIPKLVALLTDSDTWVRKAGAGALAKLSEKGKKKLTAVPVLLH
jgi:HEAT repeat protein